MKRSEKMFLGRLFLWTLMTIAITLSVVFIVEILMNKASENEKNHSPIVEDSMCSHFESDHILVKSDDTLEGICKKYLSQHKETMSAVTVQQYVNYVADLNSIDPDNIKAGTYLSIPYLEEGLKE